MSKSLFHQTAPIEEKCDVEKEVYDKFAAIGVKVLKFSGHVDRRGKYKSGLVTISPVNLNKIRGRRLGLKNCCIIDAFPP